MQHTPDLSLWDLPKTPPRQMLFTQECEVSPEASRFQSKDHLADLVKSSLVDFYCRGKGLVDFDLRELLGEPVEAVEPVEYQFSSPVFEDPQDQIASPAVTTDSKRPKRKRVAPVRPYLEEGFVGSPEGLQGIGVEGSAPRKRHKPLPSTPATDLAHSSKPTPSAKVDYRQYRDTDVLCTSLISTAAYTTYCFLIPANRTLQYTVSASEVVFGVVLECSPKRSLTLQTSTESRVLHKHDSFNYSTATSLELKNGKGKRAQVLFTCFTCS